MIENSTASIGIIGGADGPTAVVVGNGRRSLRQKFSWFLYARRRKQVIRTLRPNPHTFGEVMDYAKTLGYSEAPKDSEQYRRIYRNTKATLVMQHAPALLGDLQEPPMLQDYTPESIQKWTALQEQRQTLAEQVDDAQFPMELFLLTRTDGGSQCELIFEKLHDYFTASASGSKRRMKHFDKTVKAIYRYYGVAQSDIDNRTTRFLTIVGVLSTK